MYSKMDYIKRAKFFKTKKRLGQNFLVNPDVIFDILDFAQITQEDTVLEIGPGVGFVTEQLVKHAKKVIAIELDEEAIEELQKIECNNLEIIHRDILKTNIWELIPEGEKLKVVANIPYYITAPIIAHLLGEVDDLGNKNRNAIKDIILMVQEEVARRVVANETSPSKEYGLLTILSQFWADCKILRLVGRKCFYPAPKVNSALIKFDINEKPRLELNDYSHFRRTIKAGFAQRRKNIKNCLVNGGFNKDIVNTTLEKLNIDSNTRAENISIEKFGEISESLKNANQN